MITVEQMKSKFDVSDKQNKVLVDFFNSLDGMSLKEIQEVKDVVERLFRNNRVFISDTICKVSISSPE